LPIDPTQLLSSFDEDRPDPRHDPALAPAPEPIMDGALGAELAGELFPLAAGAHPEDDPIEGGAPIGRPPSHRLLGPESAKDGEDPLPQGIRDLPNRAQRLGLRLPPRFPLGLGPARALRSVPLSQSVTQAGPRPLRRFSDSF